MMDGYIKLLTKILENTGFQGIGKSLRQWLYNINHRRTGSHHLLNRNMK